MRDSSSPEQVGPFQFVILVLSLALLAGLAAELLFAVPPEVVRLIRFVDTAVCFVFLVDFVQQFRRAPHKGRFMKWGWIDLLASVPYVESLRWGRVFRVIRIVKLFRGVHSLRGLLHLLLASKARAGIASVFTIGFLIVSFSAVGVLLAEGGAPGNIKTAEQALWWSLVTVTTVGYGDFFPVTIAGRVVAAATMIAGVGLFGALSGVVASVLLGSNTEQDDKILEELRALRAGVAQLRENGKTGDRA